MQKLSKEVEILERCLDTIQGICSNNCEINLLSAIEAVKAIEDELTTIGYKPYGVTLSKRLSELNIKEEKSWLTGS